MKFKIICTATVEAKDELSAKKKIKEASNFEKNFGITIDPVDFTSIRFKDGNEDRLFKDSVSELGTQVRKKTR